LIDSLIKIPNITARRAECFRSRYASLYRVNTHQSGAAINTAINLDKCREYRGRFSVENRRSSRPKPSAAEMPLPPRVSLPRCGTRECECRKEALLDERDSWKRSWTDRNIREAVNSKTEPPAPEQKRERRRTNPGSGISRDAISGDPIYSVYPEEATRPFPPSRIRVRIATMKSPRRVIRLDAVAAAIRLISLIKQSPSDRTNSRIDPSISPMHRRNDRNRGNPPDAISRIAGALSNDYWRYGIGHVINSACDARCVLIVISRV